MVQKDLRFKKEEVLGIPIALVDRSQTMEMIEEWVNGKQIRHLVTVYSEFFVTALRDEEFRRVLLGADLVVPDGVSVLAALRFKNKISNIWDWQLVIRELYCLFQGLRVGGEIVLGQVGETVTGVWLVKEILRLMSKKGWKVFLLGGYGDIARQLRQSVINENSNLDKMAIIADSGSENIEDASDDDQRRVIEKINKHQPDILLVAYGPVKQEKWIARYKDQLKVKVVIGVGGTFDELGGRINPVPKWLEERGLKWLGRWWWEPKRWRRMYKAVVVFPYLVWREIVGSR